MKRFYVLESSDQAWSKIISLSYQYDFYHTQTYSLFEFNENNEPLLFVAFIDNDFIAIPLVIRKIEGTKYFDSTSVYGYCGPISNLPSEYISLDHILYFQNELLKYFKDRHIVSAFCRLHPIIDQSLIFMNFGTIMEINKTVAIDLKLSQDDQIKGYRRSNRNEINKLIKKGFIVTEASTTEEIDLFTQIYLDSMIRVNANSYYYFKKEYFHKFLNNPCFKSILLFAKIENEISAGAIFTLTNKIMQYHLAGTKYEFMKEAPMKLILDQARVIGNEHNMDILHLGGGVGGSSEDSLFYFKAGFSDLRYVYKVWQLIVDKSKYSYLIDLFKIDSQKTSNYFPTYRNR